MFAVGTNVRRIDGADKVSGQCDLRRRFAPAGHGHRQGAAQPAAPRAHSRASTRSKAQRAAGCARGPQPRYDLTVASNSFGAYVRDQQIIATDKVRYVGDMVAAVAAVDGATAQEAVSLIEVDYDELPAVFSIDEALKPGAPLVHEGLERRDPGYGRGGSHIVHDDSNICLHFRHETRRCDRRISASPI